MKTFRKGGVHPPQNKFTSGSEVKELPMPPHFGILLSQSIGAPSKPIVNPGDNVFRGQMIAEAGGFVSAPLHSPANGTVKKIEAVRTPQGLWQQAIIIEPVSEDEATEDKHELTDNTKELTDDNTKPVGDIDSMTPEEIINIVSQAGIVGLGGATFPTRVKLTVPAGKKADNVIINGAECEPYLTCDESLMLSHSLDIIKGAILIKKAVGAENILIGIESNKKTAIAAMTEAARSFPFIKVETLKTKYPQGSEKQLIYALTRKKVPTGALPIDVGCVVDNVATAKAVYDAVCHKLPLTERLVTIDGPHIARPGNYKIKIGTPLSFIIEQVGGLPENTGKIIAGGPMMGRAVSTLDSYSTKSLSGLLIWPEEWANRKTLFPCIRCAKCVSVCPMGLEPYLFMLQAENKLWSEMAQHSVMSCLECGCCSYSCPSNRPLLDMIKLGKIELRKQKA